MDSKELLTYMKTSRKLLKILLPIVVLIGAVGIVKIMVALKPEQEKNAAESVYPKITVHEVQSGVSSILIESQGTVRPRTQTRLTSRVSGHIEWVSPDFYEGGSFAKGQKLLTLDPLQYESAVAESKSRLALAETSWMQEKEAAEQARTDWESVGEGEPSPLVLREPQIAKAAADREAAQVGLEMAERNLLYTEIRAPYTGRVLSKYVDVGQAITTQVTVLGDVFAADSAEISVPLSQDDMAFIRDEATNPGNAADKPVVTLSTEIAGIRHSWTGWLDRTAAAINEQSRMITAIVRIDAPFISDKGKSLKPGMFVLAEIEGVPLDNTIKVPRAALHPGDIVYRLTDDNRLQTVPLKVVRTDAEWALVTAGISEGDRLCMTPLLFFVEGMRVEIQGDTDNRD